MSDDLKGEADARLEQAAAAARVQDPRPFYRPVLKHLRERDPPAFAAAIAHYENELLPAVAAGDADPLGAWDSYGRLLAGLLGAGRTVAVDATGGARPADGGGGDTGDAGESLVLHLPDDERAPALVLRCPLDPSGAQQATLELLVAGRVTASAYDG